jgi:hypothetical protein
MDAQILFKLSPALKEKAMEKAKSQGIPLSFVLKQILNAYVEGQFEISLSIPDLRDKRKTQMSNEYRERKQTDSEFVAKSDITDEK